METTSVNHANHSIKTRSKPIFRLIAFYFSLLMSTNGFGHEVLILKEASSVFQGRILQSIVNELQTSYKSISFSNQDIESITRKQIILTAPDLIITLGSKAARNENIKTFPVLHTLIPESLYPSLVNCGKIDCQSDKPVYGLYLDQPVDRQINLLKLLLPGHKSPGLLTAAFSLQKATIFEAKSRAQNYDFHSENIANEQELHRKLNKLLEDIDVFIALPDPLIHNRQTIPHLLLTTYRYNIPVLGFSHAYVNAGAVAAIYATPEQIAQQITELIAKILTKNPLKPGNYPNPNFEVAINKNVARSLGLKFIDIQKLKNELLQLEQ